MAHVENSVLKHKNKSAKGKLMTFLYEKAIINKLKTSEDNWNGLSQVPTLPYLRTAKHVGGLKRPPTCFAENVRIHSATIKILWNY